MRDRRDRVGDTVGALAALFIAAALFDRWEAQGDKQVKWYLEEGLKEAAFAVAFLLGIGAALAIIVHVAVKGGW